MILLFLLNKGKSDGSSYYSSTKWVIFLLEVEAEECLEDEEEKLIEIKFSSLQ